MEENVCNSQMNDMSKVSYKNFGKKVIIEGFKW